MWRVAVWQGRVYRYGGWQRVEDIVYRCGEWQCGKAESTDVAGDSVAIANVFILYK